MTQKVRGDLKNPGREAEGHGTRSTLTPDRTCGGRSRQRRRPRPWEPLAARSLRRTELKGRAAVIAARRPALALRDRPRRGDWRSVGAGRPRKPTAGGGELCELKGLQVPASTGQGLGRWKANKPGSGV